MKHPDIETIREAIAKHRGGHATTSDAGILRLWLRLDGPTRKRYLAAVTPSKRQAATASEPADVAPPAASEPPMD
jgi:hypothetical protein